MQVRKEYVAGNFSFWSEGSAPFGGIQKNWYRTYPKTVGDGLSLFLRR